MRKYVLSIDSKGITGLEIERILNNPDVHFINITDTKKAEMSLKDKLRDYSLVIWTVNAGEDDSYDLIESLTEKNVFGDIPLMIVSDCARKTNIIKAVESGAMYYVTRPYDNNALLEKISGILGIRFDKPFGSVRESIIMFTFEDILDKEIKAASRGGYPLSILLISVREQDTHKYISIEGAEILAAVFKRRLRNTDIVIRAESGAIFLLLPFVDKTGLDTVRQKINKLLDSHSVIKKAIDAHYVSFASVNFPEDGKTMEGLLYELKKELTASTLQCYNL
jgi:DNA-binding response OmpR family regulator